MGIDWGLKGKERISGLRAWGQGVSFGVLNRKTYLQPGKPYLFRLPHYGFYVDFLEKVGILGHREALNLIRSWDLVFGFLRSTTVRLDPQT